jgi:hypothetical protein
MKLTYKAIVITGSIIGMLHGSFVAFGSIAAVQPACNYNLSVGKIPTDYNGINLIKATEEEILNHCNKTKLTNATFSFIFFSLCLGVPLNLIGCILLFLLKT